MLLLRHISTKGLLFGYVLHGLQELLLTLFLGRHVLLLGLNVELVRIV